MVIRGELVLVLVAIALAAIAIATVLSGPLARWRTPVAAVGCAMAGLAPLLLYPFADRGPGSGRALWEWSAVGGPTIQASYRLDGLAATGLAVAALYGGAALVATTRISSRAALLRPALVVNTLVVMAIAVTDDFVADTVALGALAATTIFIALLVAPPAAVARITAYLTAGVQSFVVAALLVTRTGAGSFAFHSIAPNWVTPGVVFTAGLGGALFAGLYPFVPWGYRHDESGERESLRGLLTMPAGVAATIVLVRIVGTTRIDLSQLALPGVMPPPLVGFAGLLFAVALWRWLRRRPRPRRPLLFAAVALVFTALYPYLHWSHLVAIGCLLTVAYAAAVSLSQPDQWAVTRYDVTLAAAWIGIAAGTGVAVAGGIAVLLGGALAALAEAFWMPPHRAYIAMLASTTSIVASCLAVAVGVVAAADPVTVALGLVAIAAVIALELVHVGRRLDVAAAPSGLEITATLVAFLSTVLAVMLFAAPLVDATTGAFGRPIDHDLVTVAVGTAAVTALAALLAVAAGAVRPQLPDTAPLGTRLERLVSHADPVPLAAASFRALERTATAVSTAFTLFEQRAGIWLALVLIAGILTWAVR